MESEESRAVKVVGDCSVSAWPSSGVTYIQAAMDRQYLLRVTDGALSRINEKKLVTNSSPKLSCFGGFER